MELVYSLAASLCLLNQHCAFVCDFTASDGTSWLSLWWRLFYVQDDQISDFFSNFGLIECLN